jgi:hypothetical protein
MKTQLTILAFAIYFFSSSLVNYAHAQRVLTNSTPTFSMVRVVNSSASTVTVLWTDKSYDEIEIIDNAGVVFMPSIPVFNTQQIHLNDLMDGVYYINFKQQGTVVNIKMIQIQNNVALPESI